MGEHAIPVNWTVPAWGSRMTQSRSGSPAATETAAELAAAPDQALVEAFRAGRREAFEAIVARHRRQVYQVCYRFVRNHEDAADLAQEVFVRAFKGLGRFKGDASLATWLYRVAVNTSLNRVSSRRPDPVALDSAAQVPAITDGPLEGVLRSERADAVRRAIAQLPPKQRATVVLRVYQDCSHQEIAAAMGTTVGAVKANLFHALGNLRRMLRHD